MQEKERRRIIRTENYSNLYLNRYHSLKPDGNNGVSWERHGRQYSIKGIDSLTKGNTFDFVVDEEVTADLEKHRQMTSERRRAYEQKSLVEID